MSNFWANALGTAPAPAPAAPVARPPLAGYSPSPYFTPSQPQNAPQEATEQPEGAEVPGQWGSVAASLQKAQSAKLTDLCPECGSGNYFKPKGMPNMATSCFDCGYNGRIPQQSGASGLPSDKSAPVRQSRQLDGSGESNFHGQTYRLEEGGAGRIT